MTNTSDETVEDAAELEEDLTEALSMAPHTAERVLAMPLVGTLLAATGGPLVTLWELSGL